MLFSLEKHSSVLAAVLVLPIFLVACSDEAVPPTSTIVPTLAPTPSPTLATVPSPTLVATTQEMSPSVIPDATASSMAGSLSEGARDYLQYALNFIQGNALHRERVAWDLLRRDAYILVHDAQTPADTYPAIKLALERLQDRHSFFLGPDQAVDIGRGTGSGKGLIIVEPGPTVALVFPRSPADAAGVKAGDIVEEVNGVAALGKPINQVRSAIAATPRVILTLQRAPAGKAITVTLQDAEFIASLPPEGRPLAGALGYINLPLIRGGHLSFRALCGSRPGPDRGN